MLACVGSSVGPTPADPLYLRQPFRGSRLNASQVEQSLHLLVYVGLVVTSKHTRFRHAMRRI